MAVTDMHPPRERGIEGLVPQEARTELSEEDRAALWLYAHFVGARHRPLRTPPRMRPETVYDESGYPVV